MRLFIALALVCFAALSPVAHADDSPVKDHILGKKDAPVLIDEYASLGCTHCAEFAEKILPQIEQKYVDTGKVRFSYHDFPLDGISLKAAALAQCMPEDEYFPFIKSLFKNQMAWAFTPMGEGTIIQYSKLAGLSDDRAKACIADKKMLDALIENRTMYGQKYQVQATPTFIINHGTDTINGAQPFEAFAAAIDKALSAKP